jgi:hypothetical protein
LLFLPGRTAPFVKPDKPTESISYFDVPAERALRKRPRRSATKSERGTAIARRLKAMAGSWRELRFSELLALRANDPGLLLVLYCQLVGLNPGSQLPAGVSFMTMIDALLDAEALQRQADAAPDKTTVE